MITFSECQNRVINLVQKNRLDESLSLMEKAKEEFPKKVDRLGHWKANVYCLKGEGDEAISELQEVLDKGLWWNPEILAEDPELDMIKETKEFKNILGQCSSLYRTSVSSSQTLLKVEGNRDADTAIFSLHWKASNAEDFSLQWNDKGLLEKYLIGFPQSSQLFSYGCYSWDDAEKSKRDIEKTFHQFSKEYSIDQEKTIIAGASQGGGRAIELCLDEEEVNFERFIVVVPAFESLDKIEESIRTNSNKNVRGCMITGDQDPFYRDALKVASLFETAGIPCKLIVKEGMGHVFPDDFSRVFEEAVNDVLLK